jgi:pimeloyl-ACP methyl ester carboxylesterase
MNKIIKLMLLSLLFLMPLAGFSEQKKDVIELQKNGIFVQEPIFNGKAYVYISGNKFKTTIILVHGVGNDASDIWKELVPVLEKQFRVIYFDLPGFGRSDKKDSLYSPQNYAALIQWIYDTYVKGPMYLVGHSLGGAISLCYAGTYPDKIQRLILVDAAGILHRTAFTKSFSSTGIEQAGKFDILQDQVELLGKSVENKLLSETQQLLPKDFSVIYNNPFLRKRIINSPQKVAALSLMYADFSELISNIKVPVFIIWGEKDPIAPLRTCKMLTWKIPSSNQNIMPGLGHSPMTDSPTEFNNSIIKCLSDDPKKSLEKKQFIKNDKSVVFNDKGNFVIEGDYDNIIINNCRNVLMHNVSASGITINNSWLEIENIYIKSDKTALEAIDSMVTVTGGSLEGNVGISVTNSKIDLAGVNIKAENEAISTNSDINSTVVFSICEIKSKINNRLIHDILEINKNNPL